jgi:hypothetical protein
MHTWPIEQVQEKTGALAEEAFDMKRMSVFIYSCNFT